MHGLRGSDNTWFNQETGIHWPTDILKEDFDDARILAFNYDANIIKFWSPVSQNRISNHAENMLGALARRKELTSSVSQYHNITCLNAVTDGLF